MRPIDAVQVLKDINWHHKPTPVSEFESGFNQGLNQAMWIITHAPTLTPPNEPEYREYTCPNCHHTWLEDRDASDYPEYCPGCGDPLHKEENEPLTLEQVEKVWKGGVAFIRRLRERRAILLTMR